MATSNQLPAHSLTMPLSTEDEHILRQILADTRQLMVEIDRAKRLGMEVAHHEQRVGVHEQFASTALSEYFPITIKTQSQGTE